MCKGYKQGWWLKPLDSFKTWSKTGQKEKLWVKSQMAQKYAELHIGVLND